MSKMKISPTDDYAWLNEDCTLMIDGDTPKEAEIAAGKINNHNRMVEEIAELKGALKSLIGKGVDLLNVEDVSDEEDAASVHANFNDAIIKSEQLLTKLNQEGEE